MTKKAPGPFDALVGVSTTTPTKKRRGRPPGATRSPVVLLRTLEMLKHFEQARRDGLGHTAAVAATVVAVKLSWPDMKGVNRAEVERVLRAFQPNEPGPDVFRVRAQGNGGGALYIGPRWRPRIK